MTGSRDELLSALGVELPDDILTMALTHRSYAYENGGLPTNERLELLGDAVLGLVVVEELFRRHPDSSEGDLAKLRNSVVNSRALAGVARRLTEGGLGEHLLLGRGEVNTGGFAKSSILADTVESLLGAIYLQHGLDGARKVILRLFSELLDTAPTLGAALERLKPTLANGDTSGLRFSMSNALKDLSYYNQMAIDTHADHTVAQAVKNTLETACREGDPNALVPELIALLAKR